MLRSIVLIFGSLVALSSAATSEQTDHRDFQYNSVVDPATGRYNFAYDTGHDNDIAHSLHMQYQDANGIVRGRYGYTDPRGKLRMVEYEAGPNGFVARGDVGPDLFPHGEAPAAPTSLADTEPALSSYSDNTGNDFDLDPAPVQMAGWDPEADPLNQVQPGGGSSSTESAAENSVGAGGSSVFNPANQYTTVNVTSYNALDVYGPELGFYRAPYPVISYSTDDTSTEKETESNPTDDSAAPQSQPIRENEALNIYNIDVDPDDIRSSAAAGGSPVRLSRDGRTGVTPTTQQNRYQYVRTLPYSYRNYRPRQTHDHDAEMRSRYQHDHDVERRYYLARLRATHDHDAEQQQYRRRQTHDHDAEQQQYRSRQTHDHDAETKYRARQTHDHDAEKYRANHDYDRVRAAYLRRSSYYNYPRRIFYRDSHSMEPHEHYDNPVYRNYRDHQHSDRHLYGRSRNYVYPATARPSQLRYIPSDKYHDKVYYWTNE